jgi:hypothetical protein
MNVKDWKELSSRWSGLIDLKRVDDPPAGLVMTDGYSVAMVVQEGPYFKGKALILPAVQTTKEPSPKIIRTYGWRMILGTAEEWNKTLVIEQGYWRAQYQKTFNSKTRRELFGSTLEEVLQHPNADISTWTALGLCPTHRDRTLVWKCLVRQEDGSWTGNLNAPYRIRERFFYGEGMACAGPIGAVTGYANGRKECYVGAIWADRVFHSEVHLSPGAFYVPTGILVAVYKIASVITHFGGDVEVIPELVDGADVWYLIDQPVVEDPS